jgi:hypothetical protein
LTGVPDRVIHIQIFNTTVKQRFGIWVGLTDKHLQRCQRANILIYRVSVQKLSAGASAHIIPPRSFFLCFVAYRRVFITFSIDMKIKEFRFN